MQDLLKPNSRFSLFYFLLLTPLVIPNFLQLVPSTDTQPIYLISLFALVLMFSKNVFNLKLVGLFVAIGFIFFSLRYAFFTNESLGKVVSLYFFIVLTLLCNTKIVKLLKIYAPNILIIHFSFAFIITTLPLDLLYDFFYNSRENADFFKLRSNTFIYPEPSYAVKNLCALALCFYFINNKRPNLLSWICVVIALLTFSGTAALLVPITILVMVSWRIKFLLIIIFGVVILFLYDFLDLLPQRFGNIIRLILENPSLLLEDKSLMTRFNALIGSYELFFETSFYGEVFSKYSSTIFSISKLGLVGHTYLLLIFVNFLLLIFRGQIFFLLFLMGIFYADSFVYPAVILLISIMFRSNLFFCVDVIFRLKKYKAKKS